MSRPQRPVTIGIDLGGMSIRLGVYSDRQELLASRTLLTRIAAGPLAVVEEMARTAEELVREVRAIDAAYHAVGIGIGSPGPINLNTGMLGLLPNFPGWDNFPLRDALREASGLPVWLECDANAAALGEWKLGAGRSTGLQSMAMLTLGTGVGSGIILDGKVWHGMFGMGGEVGHATVNPEGPLCGCGSFGCLEMYASATALLRLAREIAQNGDGTDPLRRLVASPNDFSGLEVAKLARAGDSGAQHAFDRVGYYLGLGIANLTSTLDMPMIVVGGGLANAWDLFAPKLFETVRKYSVVYRLAQPSQQLELERHRTYIRPAVLGSSAGLLGAGLLPYLDPEAREGVETVGVGRDLVTSAN